MDLGKLHLRVFINSAQRTKPPSAALYRLPGGWGLFASGSAVDRSLGCSASGS